MAKEIKMPKALKIVVLIVTILLILSALAAGAYFLFYGGVSVGGAKYRIVLNGFYAEVVGFDSGATDVVISDKFVGLPVKSIGYDAFDKYSLKSVVIPASVERIDERAFYSCDKLGAIEVAEENKYYKHIKGNLYTKDGKTLVQYAIGKNATSFTIPDGVTSIDSYAFYSCDALKRIVIPASVKTIGNSAFSCCNALERIVIPESVESIGDYVFFLCYDLTSIEVAEGNEYYKDIDGNLYSIDGTVLVQYAIGKDSISFTIPASVKTISSSAFSGCDALQRIVIPASVETIGNSAFYRCRALGSIVIPASVETIGNFAFDSCSALKSVTFEEGSKLTSIGEYEFSDCRNLKSIVIPASVKTIGNSAFSWCNALESIVIPASVETIGDWAFRNSDALKTVYYSGGVLDWNGIEIGEYNNSLENATIIYYHEER